MKRRILLMEYKIGQKLEDEGKVESDEDSIELPEDNQAHLRHVKDYVVVDHHGVRFQKCGGGRRVIKKTGG